MYKAIITREVNRYEYTVDTRSARRAGMQYGRAVPGERVEIRRRKSDAVLATAVWDDVARAYINVVP